MKYNISEFKCVNKNDIKIDYDQQQELEDCLVDSTLSNNDPKQYHVMRIFHRGLLGETIGNTGDSYKILEIINYFLQKINKE